MNDAQSYSEVPPSLGQFPVPYKQTSVLTIKHAHPTLQGCPKPIFMTQLNSASATMILQ